MEKTDAKILDACCGGKMFYFDKNDPRVLFQDIREVETTLCDGRKFEVKPDVIGDFTSMNYPDNSFRMVVFDPPHLKYSGSKKELDGWQMLKYGALLPGWKDVIAKGFSECFRVLMPGGFLIFKWNETDIRVSEILRLTSEKPIFGHISGKRSNTHWICFMKANHRVDNIWQSAEEPPKHNRLVLVECESEVHELRHTTAYYQDGVWQYPDDWYYNVPVLKWMEIPN